MPRKAYWTQNTVKDGLEKYKLDFGHYPTAYEIDDCPYLPSSRHLLRIFGGLEEMRKILGFEIVNYGRGESRSEMAIAINKRGLEQEKRLESILISYFGEIFVHIEKPFGKSKNRVDFYIYSPTTNFGVDTFYAQNMLSLQNSINIKIDKYIDFPQEVPLYFVCSNSDLTQSQIEATSNRMSKLIKLNNIIICNQNHFEKLITNYQVHHIL